MANQQFQLYACCVPVPGHNRSIVCDIQQCNFDFIPNSLCNLLLQNNYLDIGSLGQELDAEDYETFQEYVRFLIEKDYGFYLNKGEEDRFPPIPMNWYAPEAITNAIIDINKSSEFDWININQQFETLACKALQLRFYGYFNLIEISHILAFFDDSRIRHIDIILQDFFENSMESFENLCQTHKRIQFVTIYNSVSSIEIELKNSFAWLISTQSNIESEKCCGIITHNSFYTNLPLFTESQHHNTCLNRKISIDTEGNIKNCPSMAQSFGNIKDTTLQEALAHPDFKKYWNITKDQISVCKDCEFRHICTDCRAYLENPEDMHSKPLKCGYNPYTCEWEDWSKNPLKQKAIEHYGLKEIASEA